MDRFQAMQVFVAVADSGGFAPAARTLAMSPPAVTRAIASLEERIGTRLFRRTTRSVQLTESGERFLRDSRRILTDLEEAEEAAVGSHSAPRGALKITAPVLFGRLFVTPILTDFLDRYPLVDAQTLFVDRVVNLMDEGLDVAIRIGHLPDSSLTAVRVGSVRLVTFGAPAYLREHGRPRRPEDLAGHRLVQSRALGDGRTWPYHEDGRTIAVPVAPRLQMNTNDAVIEAVSRGWGLARLLSYQVARDVRDGYLQTILDDFEPPPLPIHIVHQEGRLVSAKLRAFVDFMAERLRADTAIGR
jgi:DNA-binding transcriptional LysR family regulator